MKLDVTKAQLNAIANIISDVSAMIGVGEMDKEWVKYIRLIDRMLKKNGFKRRYN